MMITINDLDMDKVSRFKKLYSSAGFMKAYGDEYECWMGCVEFILFMIRETLICGAGYYCCGLSEDNMVLNLLKMDWYKNNLFLIKDMDMSCAPEEVKELVCMYGDLL